MIWVDIVFLSDSYLGVNLFECDIQSYRDPFPTLQIQNRKLWAVKWLKMHSFTCLSPVSCIKVIGFLSINAKIGISDAEFSIEFQ